MRLHVVLRSTAGENRKRRPPRYDKRLALASMVRAIRESGSDIDVVYLNDGVIDAERMGLMSATGEVVERPPDESGRRSGLVRSYRSAISLPVTRRWPDDDLVYFGEDDYLFCPDAFQRLLAAARAVPQASYLAFHGSVLDHRTDFVDVDGCMWMLADSTTSSFAARVGTLRSDLAVHHLGLVAANDTHIFMTLRGERALRWTYLLGQLVFGAPGAAMPLKRRLGRLVRGARLNAMAFRRAFVPRFLFVPADPLAIHWELPYRGFAKSTVDWDALADETARWAHGSATFATTAEE